MACANPTLHLLWDSVMLSADSYLYSFFLCSIWNCTLDSQQGFEVLHCSLDQTVNCLLLPQWPVKLPLLGLEHLEKSAQISRIFAGEFLNLPFIFTVFLPCILKKKAHSQPGFMNPSPLLWGQKWAVYLHFTDMQTEWQVVPRAAFRRLTCSI